MSFAIGNIGYGFDIPHHIQEEAENENLIDIIKYIAGVHTYYSANDNITPLLIGVEIAKFSECNKVDIMVDIVSKFTESIGQYNVWVENTRKNIIDDLEEELECNGNSQGLVGFLEFIREAKAKKLIIWSNS